MILQAETAVVVSNAANNTVIRTASNPEVPASGKVLDANGLRPNSTGGGYVDYGSGNTSLGDSVTFSVSVATAGAYTLSFRYANGGAGNRPLNLAVNGAATGSLPFASTGTDVNGWSTWAVQTVTVNLPAGTSSVALAIGSASLTGPNLDALAVTPAGVAASFFPPVITSSAAVSIAENTSAAVAVTATDSDNAAALTYALTGTGADAALFTINPTTGALSFITPPNFEAPTDQGANNVYEVGVQVSDGTSVVTQLVSVTVTDVAEGTNQPPVITSPASVSVAENTTAVTTVTATDSDSSTLTYALTGTGADAALFTINATTGALSFIAPRNFEAPADQGANNVYEVGVQVSDGTTVVSQLINVTVTNVAEAPVLQSGAAIGSVTTPSGTATTVNVAAGLGATDPDGDAISYIVRQVGGAALPAGMTLVNGVLTVGTGVAAGNYALEALASDGTLTSPAVGFGVTVASTTFSPITIQAEAAAIALSTGQGTITLARTPANPDPGVAGGLRPDYSGTGYVDFGDDPGDTLTFTVNVTTAGNYDLNFRYASQNVNGAARPLLLGVNGTATQTGFPDTGAAGVAGFNVWGFLTRTVALQAGNNTITLAIPPGITYGPNIDRLEVTTAGSGPIGSDNTADADGNLFLSGPDGTLSGASADSINFNIAGLDTDIVLVQISFDGGATRTTVLPDADGDFTIDGSGLSSGSYVTTVIVTDGHNNTAQSTMPITIQRAGDPDVFSTTIQAETFTIIDADGDTVKRVPGTPEQAANAANSGPGLTYDANGLWGGYTGSGYFDPGNDIGDTGQFTVTVPDSGTYHITFRYALGANQTRPMTLEVNGVQTTVNFAGTGAWSTWAEITVDVELSAGSNTFNLSNAITNGPNIDSVTIVQDEVVDTREEVYYTPIAKINFEPAPGTGGLPAGYATPAGFLVDSGAAYGDRGNGLSYGWVTEASVADGTANGTTPAANTALVTYSNTIATASDLQKTSAVMEGGGASYAWEMALANGSYQVKIAVGDTTGNPSSQYMLSIEGVQVMPTWSPTNSVPGGGASSGGRSALITAIANVTDGKLTIDSIGGLNTEIQYIEIDAIPDLTPGDGRSADLDYSYFSAPVADSLEDGQVSIAIGADGKLPTDIDPTSTLVVGVVLRGQDYRGPNITHTENVKLVETLTGVEVEIAVQISGGADTLNVRPIQPLKEFTSYTLKIEDVLDLGSLSDPNAPLRQMQDMTTTFVTGEMPEEVQSDVSFQTTVLLDGFADGAGGFTTVEFGPDGKLYVATITGEIYRWAVNSDGTINQTSKESLILDYLDAGNGERRGIIGFTFDPSNPNVIWISDNAPIPRESKAFETAEFSGRVSKITLGTDMSFTGATAQTYVTGLPRSGGDHLTNSLEFRANPDAGQPGEPAYMLYLSQGSNTAAGATDPAWGGRPERLLNASILEIDPSRTAPNGGFNVQTEPSLAGDPTYRAASGFNANGTYPGFYNPFANDAVLSIYAAGVRNAYDLVWHSNGNLYVPTNGTAAGGKTPQAPGTGVDTTIENSPKEYDWLFTVDEGGYYGHPNPIQGYYIMNGGNPTSGADPFEVVGGSDGNPTTDGYTVGINPDPDYDIDGVYSLGYNRSANGAIEYKSNIFGSEFSGALLIAQFSVGDNIRVLKIGADGSIVGDDVLRRSDGSVIDNFIDPLDIIENPATGALYLITMNRATGASQLVLLTPTPNGSGADTTADEGGDLALIAIDTDDRTAVVFQVNGLDSDITAVRVGFNGQPATTVTLDANNRFTIDLSLLPQGQSTAILSVTDDALNTASANTTFELISATTQFQHFLTIQAEDRTPNDGTSVVIPTTGGAQIVIRDAQNPQGTTTGNGMVNGLYTGAYGTDGNTNHTDGVPGGYVDFGSTNADYVTFNFSTTSASTAILRFRYANGGGGDRPLQLEVNGAVIQTVSFPATGGFQNWAEVEITVPLANGANAVTLRSVSNTGPNIDQLEILTPVPAGVDNTADEGNDLALVAVNTVNHSAVVFQVNGLDDDIVQLRVSFNGAAPITVTLDANKRFTANLSALPAGQQTAVLTVTDDATNTATANTGFVLSNEAAEYTHFLTIQAEDRTPNDGTSVVIPTTGGAQIVIRDGQNPQGTTTGNGMVNGLYTGAFGIDGNTNYDDGVRGGYLDYGSTNADFATFNFSADTASSAILRFRYANGSVTDRPLQLEVNGVVIQTMPFAGTGGFNQWAVAEINVPLVAGANSVTLRSVANTGPNIDQLEILTPSFVPVPAAINGSGRIEMEATNGSAFMESNTLSKFYFTVAENGVYKLDTAMNAGGTSGSTLAWTLNGQAIETTPFPGVGTAGEQSIYVELQAGTTYRLQLASGSAGANTLDYLDLTKAPANPNADIAIQSLDAAYFDDRLHYNYLENPVQNGFARDMKTSGQVQITNTGTAPLSFLDWRVDGPFTLANPNVFNNLTLAAGQSITVTVNFDRSKYTPPTSNAELISTVFDGKLTLYTNDQDSPVSVVNMSGFWQAMYENGQEPNVNEIWQVFGFGNRIDGLSTHDAGAYSTLANNDIYMKSDATEILSPYWQIADGVTTAKVTQIAAYHGASQAYFSVHAPGGNKFNDVDFWIHAGSDNQRLLPNIVGSTTAFSTYSFTRATIPDAWNGDDVFGLVMDGVSSDPRLNANGGVTVPGTQQGHFLKMFQAYDAQGNIIPNVYLGIMDYPGINYDYNDNLFVIEGVKPVGVGPTAALNDTFPDPDGTPTSDFMAASGTFDLG